MLGEFQTLVNTRVPIPAVISVLTGITDAMVAGAPPLRAALPAFLEFAAGSVVVAHNARFDVGFLKAACASTGATWPDPVVVDTVHLARLLVTADEAPNHRLSYLARVFHAPASPRPPGPPRRAGDRRGAAWPHRARRWPGCHVPGGVGGLLRPGPTGAPAQAPSRRRPAGRAWRLPLQGRRRPGPLCRHVRGHPHASPVLLHGGRAATPDGRDGPARVERHSHRVRHTPGGAGTRVASDRRPPTPLQQTVPPPREGGLGQIDRRALSQAVDRGPGAR